MRMDPIKSNPRTLAERVTDPSDSEPLDIPFIILGAAIIALAFFAWIS